MTEFISKGEEAHTIVYQSLSGYCIYEPTDNPFDPVDFCMTGCTRNGKKPVTYVGENKLRLIYSDEYDSKGWLLEKKKFEGMKRRLKELKKERMLFVTILIDKIYWWDITELKPKWEVRRCTATTADGTYNKGEVAKYVTFLKPEDAICVMIR